jgi:hypothetical protein
MVEFLSLELAKARLRVKRAELALKRVKEMLDEDCGGRNQYRAVQQDKVRAKARDRCQRATDEDRSNEHAQRSHGLNFVG